MSRSSPPPPVAPRSDHGGSILSPPIIVECEIGGGFQIGFDDRQ